MLGPESHTGYSGQDQRLKVATVSILIRAATEEDVPLIRQLITELAEYEKLSDEVEATEPLLHEHLFGPRPVVEAMIAELDGEPVGFALFFHNFSTFLGRPGIYLEDLFVRPHARAKGVGRALLTGLAKLAVERKCGRLEWAVLDWNEPAIAFYKKLSARPMHDWTIFRVTGDDLNKLAGESH
jgi:GNAT superfamily N-acetyltransferase